MLWSPALGSAAGVGPFGVVVAEIMFQVEPEAGLVGDQIAGEGGLPALLQDGLLHPLDTAIGLGPAKASSMVRRRVMGHLLWGDDGWWSAGVRIRSAGGLVLAAGAPRPIRQHLGSERPVTSTMRIRGARMQWLLLSALLLLGLGTSAAIPVAASRGCVACGSVLMLLSAEATIRPVS